MSLLINTGDWNKVKYVSALSSHKYTDWFFRGYKDHASKDGSMVWDYSLAKRKAGLGGKRKFGEKKMKAKKRHRTEQ